MDTLALPRTQNNDLAPIREAWVGDVTQLINEVEQWVNDVASERGWTMNRTDIELTEEVTGGPYHVPVLEVCTPEDKLVLEPAGRRVLGSDGRIDFYAWPSLFRVMLLRKESGSHTSWVVRTDSGLNWPEPWNKETFLHLSEGLLSAE